MRWVFLGAVALAIVVSGMAMVRPGRASACDAVTSGRQNIAGIVASSPVIAIGRWKDASAFEVTFVVEEPIQGTRIGERYLLDNRNDSPTRGCAAVDAQQGPRFASGYRALVLLEQVEGDWRIAAAGSAVDEVAQNRRASERYLFDGVSVRELREMAGDGERSSEWFVPVAAVVLGLAAAATVVGGVRAVRDT